MVLATDLDGTFLGGLTYHRRQLYECLAQSAHVILIFVTGRGIEAVSPILKDPDIPGPDYIICDVGATTIDAHTMKPIESLQLGIEADWPGRQKIETSLEHISGLVYQEVPQKRRCSFITNDKANLDKVRSSVAMLNCDVIYSADKFLDVLPKGVNKGSSLVKLVKFLSVSADDVLVAGDSFNDMSMYQCGFKGVAVGNAECSLIDAVKEIDDIYCANASGAGGILEALLHFPKFSNIVKNVAWETNQNLDSYNRQFLTRD